MCLTKTCFSRLLRLFIVLVLLILVSKNVKSQISYYVKQSATGLNNGSSWANAFTSLATAFSVITNKDTVRVAKGTYTPGTNALNSFQLKDSVIILGGYPDTGTPTDANRNFADYPSIMSGDIGVPNNAIDNIKIILQAINKKGFVVDGFVIENGYSGNANELGPIYFTGSTGKIDHVLIRNNFNYWGGAAINAINTTASISNSFIENNATETGNSFGSVFSISSTSNVSPSDFTLVNTIVAKNKTRLMINQNYSTSKLVNCTVFKNYGFSWIHDTSNISIQNSIFYRNGNNYGVDTAEFSKDVYSTITISNTITEVYNASGPGFLGVDPKFTDTANVAGADGKYFTTDDGLRLLNPCSPAINTGNNSFVSGINSDIAGATRIKNGIVDLGAYEVQEAVGIAPSVIYVKKNATGLNNGTSWQDAFTNLQSAFNRCSDTIKVATGIYPVSASDPGASFTLNNHRVIMGGYPDSGSPTNNDINTELYPSKLDGFINSNLKCFNIILSNNNDSTAQMIGFEIINSAPPFYNPYLSPMGTIKVSYKSAPYFEKIKMNSLTNQAAYLLYITDQSKPKFYNCAFYNGFTATGISDGARTIYVRNNSEPKFVGSYIGRDTTLATQPNLGAKFLFENSGGTIDNCTFFRAAHNEITNQNSNTNMLNCGFTKTSGRSINNIASSPLIRNCIFRDTANTIVNYGGAIWNNTGSVALIEKCSFYDSYSNNNGSAIANENSSTTIKNSTFKTGRTWIGGSSVYNNAGIVKIVNCMAYFTTSYLANFPPPTLFLLATGGSNNTIINSTIIPALSYDPVSSRNVVKTNSTSDTLKLYNSIIWRYGDQKSIDANDIDVQTANNNNAAICDIRNSILFRQPNTVLTSTLVGINPRLIDLSNPEGADNILYTTDDGPGLCTCSPAINAGNNGLNTEVSDIIGANRMFNSTIDIGAYELQNNATTAKTFFVKENAAAGGDGVSWNNAYNSLQKAVLNNCADTIKIAKGTYKASLASRDSSFNIYRGLTILGGYPDLGNPGNQDRDIVANPTILSGDIGILNDSTDNTTNILTIHCPDTTVTLDGLIIERGNADKIMPYPQNSGKTLRGGGIYAMANKYLSINECIIRNNYGQLGGGLYFQGTVIDINKSEFSNNNAQDGGGFYAENTSALSGNTASGVPVSFRNSVFNSNKGRAGTCGTIGTSGLNNFLFENLIIFKNEGTTGAGFFFNSASLGTIRNCIFAKNKNTSNTPGAGIFLYNISTQNNIFIRAQNCIFVGNNVMGATSGYTNIDFNWRNASSQPTMTIPFPNLVWCAISAGQTGPAGSGLISNTGVSLVDINNGPGLDNLWRTADDGLRPTPCSNTINKGNNTYVTNPNLPLDILDSVRILNTTVDMGPYELNSSATTNPAATITASDTTICTGTQVTFNAAVPGSNVNTVYQWMVNSTNVGTNNPVFITNGLVNNDTVKVVITLNNTCANAQIIISNLIVIQVNPTLTASVTITASANPSCTGGQVIFTAAPVNGGATASYQWKKNGINVGTNSPTYIPAPINNNDVVLVVMTSALSCVSSNPVTSNSITQVVNSLITPSVTMTHTNPGCPGSPVTFTANPVNGGANPGYQWNVNGLSVGTNSPTFTSATLNENDDVVVVMISNAPCVTITQVTSQHYIVHFSYTGTASVGITSTTMGCPGTSITFTANPVNGGSAPFYQWKVNGTNAGTNNPTFTSATLNENDVVTVVMTSNSPCVAIPVVTSLPLIVHYTGSVTASVNITSTTIGCAGSSITFTANPVNGGGAPAYQWKVNGANVGTSSPTFTSSTLNENDVVTVVMTSNAPCVSTPTVTSPGFVVHFSATTTTAVSITASSINICAGTSVTFTAIPTNEGTTPIYQWQVNGTNAGTNSNTFTTSTLNNNDLVKVTMTSSLNCASPASATSNIITMTVTPAPTAHAGNDTAICAGSSVQLLGSGGTTYFWTPAVGLNNPNIANPIATPLANTAYILRVSNGGTCVAYDTILISLIPSAVPTAAISTASNNVCTGTAVTFTATSTNGGTTPAYQWQVNGVNAGTNSNTFTTSSLTNNAQVKVLVTSSLTCASPATATSNVITMTVTATPNANAGNDVNICTGGSTQLQASGGSTYSWSPAAGLSNPNIANPVASPAVTTTYTVTVSNGVNCTANDAVVVSVGPPATPVVSISTTSNTICQGSAATFTAVATNGGSNPVFQWQVNGVNAGTNNNTFTIASLSNNSQVKVILTSSSACVTSPNATSNTITMQVEQLSTPLINITNQLLAVSNPDAGALYTWQIFNGTFWSNVIPTATGTNYTAPASGTYRVKAVKGPCTSYSASAITNIVPPFSHFIYVHPNPANQFVTFDSIALSKKYESLEIIDMEGRRIMPLINIRNQWRVTVDINILSKGMYMAIFRTWQDTFTALKFIKQ